MELISVPKPIKRKKKSRKFPKAGYKAQEKRMDDLFAILIKLNSGLKCEFYNHQYQITDTGKIPSGLQCSHFYSRNHRNTRWSYQNCRALNAGKHQYFDANKEIYREWLIEKGYHTDDSLVHWQHIAHSTFRGDRSLIEIWIIQELEKVLPEFPELNYDYLKPIYERLR